MARFLGKFSFFYGDRMLVYFGYRAGLILQNRTTIFDADYKEVPLPPEASKFLAYDAGNGECLLYAHNGEPLALGGNELQVEVSSVGTSPAGNPKFHDWFAPMRVLYAPLRNARKSGQLFAGLQYQCKSRRAGDIRGFLIPSPLSEHVRHDYDKMRGLFATNITGSGDMVTWRFEQYADGVDEILEAKKVRLFDFAPVGKAVVDVSKEEFRDIDFVRADFTGANFNGALLHRCFSNEARFTNANFNGATFFGGDFYKTDFTDTSMQGTTFQNTGARGCNFTRVDMTTVIAPLPLRAESTERVRSRFTGAKIRVGLIGPGAWDWMILDDAQIDGIEQIPKDRRFTATNANLSRVNLSKLDCKYADFTNAELRGTVFSGANLPGAKFTGAKLDEAVLSTAQLQTAKFQNAQLSKAHFSAARLEEANFDGATMLDVDFSNAYLESVTFTGVEQKQMSGTLFNRAFLVNSNLSGIDLATRRGERRSSLTEAYLQGANLSGAQLAGTNLTSAGIATESGSLSVKLPDLPPVDVYYEPTIIDPWQSTNSETVCPNGQNGPCDGDKLKPKTPFPDVYPWPRRKEESAA